MIVASILLSASGAKAGLYFRFLRVEASSLVMALLWLGS